MGGGRIYSIVEIYKTLLQSSPPPLDSSCFLKIRYAGLIRPELKKIAVGKREWGWGGGLELDITQMCYRS